MRLLLATGLFVATTLPVAAQTRQHTVVDYYKMLPARFFEVEHPTNATSRMKWLQGGFDKSIPADNRSIIDLKNDFLRCPGDGAQFHLDVAIFRFHGRETVAVREKYALDEDLSFWRLQKGRLVEVTKQVFPFRFDPSGLYIITVPRYGTTIQVVKSSWPHKPPSQTPISFVWRGGYFART